MNTQNTISGVSAKLVPFRAIATDADFVIIQPGQIFNPYPTFQVLFGKLTPAVPAQPAIPQKSGPNLPDYVPASPAVPEVPSQFETHRTEVMSLTQDEWDNWDRSVSDEDYIRALVQKRYGVTIAK